jgi:hypothetical protein
MAKGALFVGWGPLIPGREKTGAGVLGEALEYLQRLQGEGILDSIEAAILEPHGGDLGGFVLVKGDKEGLAQLRVDDGFVRTIVGVQLVHQNVGVAWAYTDAAMQGLFTLWEEQEERLL